MKMVFLFLFLFIQSCLGTHVSFEIIDSTTLILYTSEQKNLSMTISEPNIINVNVDDEPLISNSKISKSYIYKDFDISLFAVVTVQEDNYLNGLIIFNSTFFEIRKNSLKKIELKPWKCGNDEKQTITKEESFNEVLQGPIPFFPNCYYLDSFTREFHIGIIVDSGYYDMAGSINQVKTEVETMVSITNIIYYTQLNIVLKVDTLNIITTPKKAQFPFNMNPSLNNCNKDSYSVLNSFSNWNANQKNKLGIWHMLTTCWPFGVVGIANIRSICTDGGVGISNRGGSDTTWYTFAHEVGHNFGAFHTFQNGVGTTGGIMDYGDPYINGYAQFNVLSKQELCSTINTVVQTCSFFKIIDNKSSQCGDGILQTIEECECINKKRSCKSKQGSCVNCRLSKKIICSSGMFVVHKEGPSVISATSNNLSNKECCNKEGLFLGPDATCNNNADVCITGKCTRICSSYGLPSCAPINEGCTMPCRQGYPYGQCKGDILTDNGLRINWISDGTPCGISLLKRCLRGSCISSTIYYSKAPTKNPTKVPTRRHRKKG
jgi:hypothetical protein